MKLWPTAVKQTMLQNEIKLLMSCKVHKFC